MPAAVPDRMCRPALARRLLQPMPDAVQQHVRRKRFAADHLRVAVHPSLPAVLSAVLHPTTAAGGTATGNHRLHAAVPDAMPGIVRHPAVTSSPLLGRLPNVLLADLCVCRATMCRILHAGLRTDVCRSATRLHAAMPAAVRPAEYAVSAVPDRLSSPAAANRPGDDADQHRSIHPVPTSVRVQLRQSMHPAESSASFLPAGLRPELPTVLCPAHSDGMPVRSSAVPVPNRILAMR
ncbi:hypothetical protein ANCDUO_12930 [Ancylostoma duodenale]|uniref:Uncharacterized protein n=1 Tax=Ancylostoma duodenale TaxID=51022 RepID=A0A0C2GIJ5_9BILA|nr:hypothetical protein ANCDUO_12930 [Ancylostoma duodenale]